MANEYLEEDLLGIIRKFSEIDTEVTMWREHFMKDISWNYSGEEVSELQKLYFLSVPSNEIVKIGPDKMSKYFRSLDREMLKSR